METPKNTLLVVLPIVTLILTLSLLVGARQAGRRPVWVLGFAIHPLSQLLRQFVTSISGRDAGLPFGHAGGFIAARAGDEFGLVLDIHSEQALLVFAERLRAAVEGAPFDTRAGPVPTTVSIGAALAHGGEETPESVWDRTDLALLEAKRTGRNRVISGARRQVVHARAPDLRPG